MSDVWNSIRDTFNDLPTWGKAVVGIVAVGASSHFLLGACLFSKRRSPYKTDYKPGTVYVYQFPRAAVIPSISPYALKLETWLRMADLEYENVKVPLYVRSKEGQLPFVELNGIEYCDSSLIIRDLIKLLKKENVDNTLSEEQLAISRAFEQMVENSTLQSYAYIRYTEQFDELLSEKIAFPIPFWWRLLMPTWLLKRQSRKRLYLTGIGRHSRDEIVGIGFDDLRSISVYLGTKQFLHGDTPTTVDAFLFGVLAQILYVPLKTPHQQLINTGYQNLARYCDRIKAMYWPDWDVICKTRALNTWKRVSDPMDTVTAI